MPMIPQGLRNLRHAKPKLEISGRVDHCKIISSDELSLGAIFDVLKHACQSVEFLWGSSRHRRLRVAVYGLMSIQKDHSIQFNFADQCYRYDLAWSFVLAI